MNHSLRISLVSSCVITGLLFATGCSEKEQCSLENSESSKIVTQTPTKAKEIGTTSPHPESAETMNIVKTTSGLSYQTLENGDSNSATPTRGSMVTVHYTGWLSDDGKPGKEFDSSKKHGKPFQFNIGVGHVIAGWDEGVMTMHKGEKRRLYIPSRLGYGASGAGKLIPPFADLIFDVELIDFK